MAIFTLLLITISPFFLATNTWNGITPLESTRIDVENILGKRDLDSKAKDAASYTTKNEKVFVIYSGGNCNIKLNGGWNVEKGKVISLSVYPTIPLKFADYKFDKTKFSNYVEDYVIITTYTNKTDGIGFSVNTEEGTISHFTYFPKSEDDYLLCEKEKQ